MTAYDKEGGITENSSMVRIETDLYETLKTLAARERRSTTRQLEVILIKAFEDMNIKVG